MKLVVISVHFEYEDMIEAIVDRHPVDHYFVYPRIDGRDSEGYHEGSQVHPGNLSAIHVRLENDAVQALLDDLEHWRLEKKAHHHLEAVVLNIEGWIGPSPT
jgi:hypothetical protein